MKKLIPAVLLLAVSVSIVPPVNAGFGGKNNNNLQEEQLIELQVYANQLKFNQLLQQQQQQQLQFAPPPPKAAPPPPPSPEQGPQ